MYVISHCCRLFVTYTTEGRIITQVVYLCIIYTEGILTRKIWTYFIYVEGVKVVSEGYFEGEKGVKLML